LMEPAPPNCITIDSQTLEDEKVAMRERDSMVQTEEKITELVKVIEDRIRFRRECVECGHSTPPASDIAVLVMET
jgi:hypothetical protein